MRYVSGIWRSTSEKAELQENEFALITKHGDLEDITLKITFTSQEAM